MIVAAPFRCEWIGAVGCFVSAIAQNLPQPEPLISIALIS